jgi:putative ABC transport system ATP-binding protein
MSDHLVDVSKLSFWYRQGEFEHQVLQEVSLHLNPGEVVGLTGPSGSGKSTLLTIIGGLRSAEHGTVTALGTEVTGSSERQRVVLRRRIGFIFQQHNLAPALTVAQNIQMGLQHSDAHLAADAGDKIEAAAAAVGIAEHLRKHPNQLSGGQQQRAGIARALVNDPKLVLADEPTASLDKVAGEVVLQLFEEMALRGAAVVLVTHDRRVLEQTHRILMLEGGRLVPPVDQYLKQASESVRTLMHLDSRRLGRMLSFGHALAQVALADGRVDPVEREAIVQALTAKEVFSGPEVDLVVDLALAQALAWHESTADDLARSELGEALRVVAAADHVVTDSERAVIDALLNRR